MRMVGAQRVRCGLYSILARGEQGQGIAPGARDRWGIAGGDQCRRAVGEHTVA